MPAMEHLPHFREEYPRPQFSRSSFVNLNGPWDFAFDDENLGPKEHWECSRIVGRSIQVPFAYESKASGVDDASHHFYVYYGRPIPVDLKEIHLGKRLILNFEGVDYDCEVYLNGKLIGTHEGAYERFSFDITDRIQGQNDYLCLHIVDKLETNKPRGKQTWHEDGPFGCWYTQTTGIYKTVWMEYVSPIHLTALRIASDEAGKGFDAHYALSGMGDGLSLKATASFKGKDVSTCVTPIAGQKEGTLHLEIPHLKLWSPEKPNLYEIRFSLLKGGKAIDEVSSYAGYKTFEAKGNRLYLNGEQAYLRLCLEQGYYPEGGLTPLNYEELEKEALLIKNLGFNGLRLHQKSGDERFYYLCDVLGLFVTVEMASPYSFDENTIRTLKEEWPQAVRQYQSHPSIIAYLPINESWGVPEVPTSIPCQTLVNDLVKMTKELDPKRLVISNDGWEHTVSDVITTHDYDQDPAHFYNTCAHYDKVLSNEEYVDKRLRRPCFCQGYSYHGEPVVMDELCGIGFEKDGAGWGYGTSVHNEEEYLARLNGLIHAVVSSPYFSGFCITQITDVYQEINGLATMNRVLKAPLEKLRAIITQE